MRSPVQPRGGFTAFPREWRRLARENLEPAQRAFLDDLAEAATWEPGPFRLDDCGFTGISIELEAGEVVVPSRGKVAQASGLNRDQVRRALDRFEALGFVARRPAFKAAPPSAPGSAPRPAPHAAPPPTVVRVLMFREVFWPETEAAPPPAPSPAPGTAPQPAPIQQGNQGTPNTEKRSSPPRALPTRHEAYAAENPATARLLAALDALRTPGAWASSGDTRRVVEGAIGDQDVEAVAVRVAAAIRATGKPWLGHHVDSIRPPRRAPRHTHGDLGVELSPWTSRLTREEYQAATAELRALGAIDPDLAAAPLGVTSYPESPAFDAVQALNAKWRAVADSHGEAAA